MRKVSGNLNRWRLPDFFCGLFNYCFLVSSGIRQRRKLLRCYRGMRVYNLIFTDDDDTSDVEDDTLGDETAATAESSTDDD